MISAKKIRTLKPRVQLRRAADVFHEAAAVDLDKDYLDEVLSIILSSDLVCDEDEDRIRVSLRSKKGVSANRCAALYFNGGGHEQAAGGRLSVPEDVKSIDEVAAYTERVTHEFMNSREEQMLCAGQ